MTIFNVEIVSYDTESDSYKVRYCVDLGLGSVRRSVAIYSGGTLSRDNDKPGLLEEVKRLTSK
jgi:hypothetical protein